MAVYEPRSVLRFSPGIKENARGHTRDDLSTSVQEYTLRGLVRIKPGLAVTFLTQLDPLWSVCNKELGMKRHVLRILIISAFCTGVWINQEVGAGRIAGVGVLAWIIVHDYKPHRCSR